MTETRIVSGKDWRGCAERLSAALEEMTQWVQHFIDETEAGECGHDHAGVREELAAARALLIEIDA